MEERLFPLKNCSGLTEEQLMAVAYARGITAATCCVILLMVLVVLLILAIVDCQRVCGTVVKRLAFGFTAANVLYEFTLALNLKYYFDPEDWRFCQADGFFDQYFGSVQLLFTLGICLVLFLKVAKVTCSGKYFDECYKKAQGNNVTCCSKEINKVEIALLSSIFGLPLLFDWIPFTTHSYGPSGSWCWIRSFENDCSEHNAGLWEQIWLWGIPLGLVILITLGTFVTSLCLIGYAIKTVKLETPAKVGITDTFLSLAFLAFMLILSPPQVIAYSYSFKGDRYLFWVSNAVSTPLTGTFVPLALMILIHLPLSSCVYYKRHTHTGHRSLEQFEDQATLHRSSDWSAINQPSHTTWDSPHSQYGSANVSLVREQLQDYGSIA